MPNEPIPEVIRELADARQGARLARDWPEADRLRTEIEAAGWIVTDQAHSYRLAPAHPADVIDAGVPRYGSSRSVPSRLDEPAIGLASIVLVATDWPDDLEHGLASVVATVSADVQVVIVANQPSAEQETALHGLESRLAVERSAGVTDDGPSLEIVWTSARLGHATALNVGLRRVAGPIVVLVDTSVEAMGDFVTPLVRTLDDPTVAVAGAWGLVSADLRHFTAGRAGNVTAIAGMCQAFRRSDVVECGPLDEHFGVPDSLDIWWSLVLRDVRPDETPRRAVALDLPLVRHEIRDDAIRSTEARTRLARRNLYRIIDRFNGRLGLAESQ